MNLFKMEVPEFPKREFLLHNRMDLLTEDQCIWWDALVRLSDVISLTMQGNIQRTTGAYLEMLFTDFLDKLYDVLHTQRLCGKEFIFDDFINIAVFSVSALKHIVASPSTHIVKNAEKVHVSSLHQTGSKTMQWMAKRPGRSVQEKIAPQNKVMTNVTHFSTDTKENRESIYLYGILHDIVRDRVRDTNCLRCEHASECGVPTKDIRDLLGLHAKIRHGDLADVRAEKQSLQNNKLMCDVNYKMVWDGVKQLSRIEENLFDDWSHLKERYLQLGFWAVLTTILHETDTEIIDCYGVLTDEKGLLSFRNTDGETLNNSVTIYPAVRAWEPFLLELSETELSLYGNSPYEGLLFLDLASIDLPEKAEDNSALTDEENGETEKQDAGTALKNIDASEPEPDGSNMSESAAEDEQKGEQEELPPFDWMVGKISPKIRKESIKELLLGYHSRKCLTDAGIKNIGELEGLDLSTIEGLTPNHANEIRYRISLYTEEKAAQSQPVSCDPSLNENAKIWVIQDVPENIMNDDIGQLGLSVRSYNCLNRAGFRKIADIKGADLSKVRNLGRKNVDEISDKLKKYSMTKQ